jgi:putative transposase
MYDYRKLSPSERQSILRERRARGFPLHAPPHFDGIRGEYLITAASFEHRHIFEQPDDLSTVAGGVLGALTEAGLPHPAWVFLPNHYHILLETDDLATVTRCLRVVHSSLATLMNGRHRQRGRRVWYRYSDRLIRNEKHHWATVNYIHFNPAKHGYVSRMADWPWSSVHDYLDTHGREWAARVWKSYPVGDYGKGWDW